MKKTKLGVGTVWAGRDSKGKVMDTHLEIVRFYKDENNREMVETARYSTNPKINEPDVRVDWYESEVTSMLRRNQIVIILHRDYTKRNA